MSQSERVIFHLNHLELSSVDSLSNGSGVAYKLASIMASIPVFPRQAGTQSLALNPLPQLIQTPSGLALLELQGTINLPQNQDGEDGSGEGKGREIVIGRLDFPDYHPNTQDSSSTSWMKRVYLYIGQHQRLTGEVKKLPRAIAIVRRKGKDGVSASESARVNLSSDGVPEELEVAEIVKYKLVFSQRPEPVGTAEPQ